MTTWLIDKSAISRLHLADNEWASTIERGLVHLDRDFDLIALVTGQPLERLATA